MSGTRRKRSEIWMHFTAKGDDKAICDHCKHELSCKTTISNLKKHFETKHSTLGPLTAKQPIRMSSVSRQPDSPEQAEVLNSTTPSIYAGSSSKTTVGLEKQTLLSSFITYPTSFARQKRLNNMLLKMIIKDMQPFSIVEDQGFQDFISAIDPSYKLPNRKMIARELLVDSYRDTIQKVTAIMDSVESVCLTTDSWTSVITENYLAVTAHFLNQDFQLESCLLECSSFRERHTQENLKQELIRITKEWKIQDKVVLIVTDNAPNIVNAVKMAKFKHLPCFAHRPTLNLVVQKGIVRLKPLQQKIKVIIEHFHRSTVAAEKFASLQSQMNPNKPPLKLKNDVLTRWNSTYEMFERIVDVQEPLEAALGVLHNPVENLSTEDWQTLPEICKVLKPFDLLTKEICAEKSVTVSKIIVLANGLLSACQRIKQTLNSKIAKEVMETLIQNINTRFANVENNPLLARATLLDPRFKRNGFCSATAYDQAYQNIVDEVCSAINADLSNQVEGREVEENNAQLDDLLWGDFDRRNSEDLQKGTPRSSAIVEVRQYINEAYISRRNNPLLWWKSRESVYAHLSKMAKAQLCMMATSVPSERVFSKCGQVISDRRSRLKAKHVKMIIFLNCNFKHMK